MEGIRLTKEVREKVLLANEGKVFTLSIDERNLKSTSVYTIRGGKMYVKRSGKTSWADSHFVEEEEECDSVTVRRILNRFANRIDWSSVD